MRKAILGAASALALASPVVAAGVPVTRQLAGYGGTHRVPDCAACRCEGAGSRRSSPPCHRSAAGGG